MFEQLSYLKFQTLMKYLISSIVVIALLVLYADAEGIDTIVPDTSLWGLSRNDFKGLKPYDYSETQIGKSKCLFRSKLNIEGYIMDVYYIFGEKMWNSDGWTYKGVIQNRISCCRARRKHETTELNECRDSLIITPAIKYCHFRWSPDPVPDTVPAWGDQSMIDVIRIVCQGSHE